MNLLLNIKMLEYQKGAFVFYRTAINKNIEKQIVITMILVSLPSFRSLSILYN